MTARFQTHELAVSIQEILMTGLLPPGEPITLDSDLFEAGLDSMSIAQLLLELQERTGVWIDEGQLTRDSLQSCNTFAKCVQDWATQRASGVDAR